MILEENNDAAIRLAIKSLQLDNLIILPTDTIYGIAANAKSDIAVQKIYDIKKRNKNKAIAVFAIVLGHIPLALSASDMLDLNLLFLISEKERKACFVGKVRLCRYISVLA